MKRNILAQASLDEVMREYAQRAGLDFDSAVPASVRARLQRETFRSEGRLHLMLTAASIVYFVVCHVLTQPVRRLAIRQTAPVYATAGLLIAVCLAVYGAAWPKPEVQRNFREVVESFSISLENGGAITNWDIHEAEAHEPFHGLAQNIPSELLPDSYHGIVMQPLLVQTPVLPHDEWLEESGAPLLAQSNIPDIQPSDDKTTVAKTIEPPKPLEKGVKYTIQSGDNMWYVAKRFGVKHDKLVAYNPLVNPRAMQPGDKIYVPGVTEPMLKNIITNRMIMPIANTTITSNYGMRKHPLGGAVRFHHGIDIRAKYGTPIKAVLPGIVKTAAYQGSKGNTVIIQHDNGLQTVYAHCSKFKAKRGQRVNQGETISYVGNTGRVTGTHLHFEVLKAGKSQDPIKYLPYKPRYVKSSRNRS
ncbi:MAG: LysM peptidoglycan-binding domain-containing M23 family metallopeptidase [Candidatus Hinthialibacter antarcticus]|nr:LysM peptidoglycan-binding domain-containing M23 family metallopeptidase [Candidatus Hinthialibacter antarcticus]